MGINVNGVMAFGIKLDEDQVYDIVGDFEDGEFEFFDSLFESYEKPAKYEGLIDVYFGSYEFPTHVIAIKYIRADDWTCSVIHEKDLILSVEELKKIDILMNFCNEYNLKCEPEWYFGAQYG